jgi:hypothetical protein
MTIAETYRSRPIRSTGPVRLSLYKLIASFGAVAALALPAPVTAAGTPKPFQGNSAQAQPKSTRAQQPTIGSCTMAVPPTHATVEAEIANADDFCEVVSQALAVDVFGRPVLVTPGVLWHYADTTRSCRLRYGTTSYRMTIRNSAAACRWLARLAPAWHLETRRPGDDPEARLPRPLHLSEVA